MSDSTQITMSRCLFAQCFPYLTQELCFILFFYPYSYYHHLFQKIGRSIKKRMVSLWMLNKYFSRWVYTNLINPNYFKITKPRQVFCVFNVVLLHCLWTEVYKIWVVYVVNCRKSYHFSENNYTSTLLLKISGLYISVMFIN